MVEAHITKIPIEPANVSLCLQPGDIRRPDLIRCLNMDIRIKVNRRFSCVDLYLSNNQEYTVYWVESSFPLSGDTFSILEFYNWMDPILNECRFYEALPERRFVREQIYQAFLQEGLKCK